MRLATLALVLLVGACGDDDVRPCLVADDCPRAERCVNGFCVPPETDVGPEDVGRDAPDPVDAGTDVPTDVPVCRPDEITPFPGAAPCARSVRNCIDDCSGELEFACIDNCIREGGPQCRNCTGRNQAACFRAMGCATEWDCYAECADTMCGSPFDLECGTVCPLRPVSDCNEAMGVDCDAEFNRCFQ